MAARPVFRRCFVVVVRRRGGVRDGFWSVVGGVPVFTGSARSRVHRPRAELLITSVVEKRLGSLPASAQFLRRLDVAGMIDGLCPMRTDIAHISHGQVIEVLIANRLSSPMPMFKVNQWAAQWAVEEVFGITPDFLNDDRIGRALDPRRTPAGVTGQFGQEPALCEPPSPCHRRRRPALAVTGGRQDAARCSGSRERRFPPGGPWGPGWPRTRPLLPHPAP
ncbi:DUF4277 domain-containing protein [Actinacidiphila oryziradicis]|uniref:DUF4277 domain-containing protein n=1 Tax=Actinacidiphila oryziradicis TaxID=2571141 RepID=A0A4U0RHE3_9ACTN|nr:DUF4277 domain-containing protein [Actinacidiphila oryziradicis]